MERPMRISPLSMEPMQKLRNCRIHICTSLHGRFVECDEWWRLCIQRCSRLLFISNSVVRMSIKEKKKNQNSFVLLVNWYLYLPDVPAGVPRVNKLQSVILRMKVLYTSSRSQRMWAFASEWGNKFGAETKGGNHQSSVITPTNFEFESNHSLRVFLWNWLECNWHGKILFSRWTILQVQLSLRDGSRNVWIKANEKTILNHICVLDLRQSQFNPVHLTKEKMIEKTRNTFLYVRRYYSAVLTSNAMYRQYFETRSIGADWSRTHLCTRAK